ncbi:hypothetical protein ABPG72_012503 [Tetrahymena utriculariae]
MSRFTINSNQSLTCQLQNYGVNHQFTNKKIHKNLSDSEIILCVPKDLQANQSKNQVVSNINTLRFIQPTSPQKQYSNNHERDNIQNLKCFGDQNVLENDYSSSNTIIEDQLKAKEIVWQNDLQNFKSHLVEMEKIESGLQEQEKYLNQFLIKIKNQKQNIINPVDQHIFQSLLINDEQLSTISNFNNLQNINLEKNLSIDFQPRLSKLLIDFQKIQNKTRSQII